MKFTISPTHPVYQHCKVTAYLTMFQRLPMLAKKPCQVESIKTVAMTLPCENNVHTASFTFSLFLFTLSRTYLTYVSFCVSK